MQTRGRMPRARQSKCSVSTWTVSCAAGGAGPCAVEHGEVRGEAEMPLRFQFDAARLWSLERGWALTGRKLAACYGVALEAKLGRNGRRSESMRIAIALALFAG